MVVRKRKGLWEALLIGGMLMSTGYGASVAGAGPYSGPYRAPAWIRVAMPEVPRQPLVGRYRWYLPPTLGRIGTAPVPYQRGPGRPGPVPRRYALVRPWTPAPAVAAPATGFRPGFLPYRVAAKSYGRPGRSSAALSGAMPVRYTAYRLPLAATYRFRPDSRWAMARATMPQRPGSQLSRSRPYHGMTGPAATAHPPMTFWRSAGGQNRRLAVSPSGVRFWRSPGGLGPAVPDGRAGRFQPRSFARPARRDQPRQPMPIGGRLVAVHVAGSGWRTLTGAAGPNSYFDPYGRYWRFPDRSDS